jgi:hypothetical protein
MNDRPPDIGRTQKQEEVYSKPEAEDFEGAGNQGQEGGRGSKEWHTMTLYRWKRQLYKWPSQWGKITRRFNLAGHESFHEM